MFSKFNFNTEHKDIYIRRLCFCVGLVITAVLQNTNGLFPSILGARPMLLIPAAVCLAMFEREIPGMIYGVCAGLLWDVSSASSGNFNAILLSAAGFICGSLITHIMRNNLVTAVLLGSVATALHELIYWIRVYIFGGNLDDAETLFTFYIPSFIYTVVLIPVFYLIIRFVMKKTSEQ